MSGNGKERFWVITGGPGSGKSTLVKALVHKGIHAMPEAGRAIIQDQMKMGGSALPWADRSAFAELMLAWDLRSYKEAEALTGAVVFDRGVLDVVAYCKLSGLDVPKHVRRAATLYRYRRTVFLAPCWAEIYRQDEERKQNPEEVKRTCDVLKETYLEAGYELVELPRVAVEERVRFVLPLLEASV